MKKAPIERARRDVLEPPVNVRAHAAQVIERHRLAMEGRFAVALEGRDPEGVHDVRVASRRLRAALAFFAPCIEEGQRDRLERDLRAATKALGRVRDFDVLRLKFAELVSRSSPVAALALESLDARLARQRRRARTKMMRRFASIDLDRLNARLKRLTASLRRRPLVHAERASAASSSRPVGGSVAGSAPQAGEAVAAALADQVSPPVPPSHDAWPDLRATGDASMSEVIQAVAPRLVETLREVVAVASEHAPGEPGSAEALHAARIAAKRLRYELEIVAPYLENEGADVLRTLKKMQDGLGRFHDDAVLDETLNEAAELATTRELPHLARELVRIRGVRRRVLGREEHAVIRQLRALAEQEFPVSLARALARASAADEQQSVSA
jgi:CHAD domain-containing protein